MRNSIETLLPLALLFPLCLAHQQILQPQSDIYSPLDTAFAQKVHETLEYFHIPGLSISIVNGSEIYAAGYGLASLPSTPAGPETLYYAGSTTKAFTAAAVSLLVDNGTVTWKTRVSDLIRDDFVLSDDYATTHVTLEDMLSHRTGLPRHDLTLTKSSPNSTTRDVIRQLRNLPMTAEIRTKFQYCNLGFMTAGYIVEQLTSQWLGDFLYSRIWEPLGMSGTFFSPEDADSSSFDFAHGYAWDNATEQYIQLPWTATDIDSGAGAVISNVVDYGKWLRMMIHHASPLSPAGHEELMTPRSIIRPNYLGLKPETMTGDAVYSLGWWKYTYRGQLVVSHGGSVTGFGALALYLPDLKWGVTIMANTQGSSNVAASELSYHLLDEILHVPSEERYNWRESYENDTAASEHFLANAKQILYPSIPSPPIPHALALESYAGNYSHPAFPPFTLNAHGEDLRAIALLGFFDFEIVATHVTGEHWLADVRDLRVNATISKSRMEFRVDVTGAVTEFGFEIDAELAAIGEKTWFAKEV